MPRSSGQKITKSSGNLPDPRTSPELFEDVLQRRVIAFLIDFIIIAVLGVVLTMLGMVAGIFTFGLAWLGLPLVGFIAPLLYYTVTLGGTSRATLGMRKMDIVLTSTRADSLDSWRTIAHVVLFWLSWSFTPLIFAIGLFSPRRQLGHDLLVGTLMVRRSPMDRHWDTVGAY